MFKSLKYVWQEHKENKKLILLMAKEEMKKAKVRTSIGIAWDYIHDLIYFFVYTLFRVVMSGSGNVDGMESVLYVLTGLIPWFFMNEVLVAGTMAVKKNKGIIRSIKFPITIIPTIDVVSIFIKRSFTLLVLYIVSACFGHLADLNILLLLYYMLAMFAFMLGLNMLISAFVAISEDFHQIFLALVRILFFFIPVLWSFLNIPFHSLRIALKLNPIVYVIEGFRDAFVLGGLPSLRATLYFWVVTIVVSVLGCFVQYRLRKYYADIM